MNIGIPGKGKATYTKHVEAGIACIKPVVLLGPDGEPIKAKDVQSETLFLPAGGRRGSGKRIWKQFELLIIDETVLHSSRRNTDITVLQEIVEGAGQYIGWGRYRPRNNGHYGRFTTSKHRG